MVTLRQTENERSRERAASSPDEKSTDFERIRHIRPHGLLQSSGRPLLEKAFSKLAMDAYGSPSGEKCHPIYEDIAFFQLIGYHSAKFKYSVGIRHLPSMIFTKLLIKYLATQTKKTFLILRSEELWKETLGEGLWGQLEANGRIITKEHKGISQHITRDNIKKDNGYDKLVNILKNHEQKQN